MKIGVISDTHGSFSAWDKAYARYLSQTDLIIHCGDVLYHGPRNPLPAGYDPGALLEKINALEKPLLLVRGNCDAEVDQMVLDFPLEAPYAHLFTGDYRILVHHGHLELPAKAKKSYDLIISGHTHCPGIKEEDGVIYLNPGSPALPKDEGKTPTLAVIDGRQIVILNLETGEVVRRLR